MSIRDSQRAYYERLLREHGRDPRALGHRDRATQEERFARLARILDDAPDGATLHEIGCGFGDFGAWLARHRPDVVYSGSDVVESFVDACRARFPGGVFHLRDLAAEPAPERYDVVTLSGTFNGRLDTPADRFRAFIDSMLLAMYEHSRIGIAYNFLDAGGDWQDPQLHYESIGDAATFARQRLSRHVEIDASGPLYEFTVRVWRPEVIAARYDRPEFARYFRDGPSPGGSSR